MVSRLKLSGNELLVFALIYGFCQDEQSEFTGSLSYVMKWLNCSKPTAVKALSGLVEKELVFKEVYYANSVRFVKYKVNLPLCKKLNPGMQETLLGGMQETLPNSTSSDSSTYTPSESGEKSPSLFPDFDKNKKTMFRNSIVGNIITFKEQFKEPAFQNINLDYYFEVVADWNEIKRTTRTARGWIATAKNFMKGDNEKGKLKLINPNGKALTQETIDYLNL